MEVCFDRLRIYIDVFNDNMETFFIRDDNNGQGATDYGHIVERRDGKEIQRLGLHNNRFTTAELHQEVCSRTCTMQQSTVDVGNKDVVWQNRGLQSAHETEQGVGHDWPFIKQIYARNVHEELDNRHHYHSYSLPHCIRCTARSMQKRSGLSAEGQHLSMRTESLVHI